MSTLRRGACWGVAAPGRQALGQLRGSGLGGGDRGQGSFSFTRFSSPSHSPAFEMQGCIFFFFNYFELLEMIYELLYQAPNSFITCFLKESSKEQSVSVELEPTANTAPRDL